MLRAAGLWFTVVADNSAGFFSLGVLNMDLMADAKLQ